MSTRALVGDGVAANVARRRVAQLPYCVFLPVAWCRDFHKRFQRVRTIAAEAANGTQREGA